ncbi:MAG: threonine synthase [Clostridia bacterium]|nr:threonine synthase [Clostridia bacterium]
MLYQSTRDTNAKKISGSMAIKQGLASDGGLFVPESIPALTGDEISALCKDSYPVRAAKILAKFLTDYTYDELISDCEKAYSAESFEGGCAPLAKVRDGLYSLELWHGPTSAFKDMALQIMPRLLSRALVKNEEKRTALILVATSGDTGKAALEGYKDIDGIKIMVYYPVDGVSRVQKLQMATQEGSNVNVCAIRGNFDDAQNGVKAIFGNSEAAEKLNDAGFFLSSANSINWGRLAPQIVYYISAYCDLLNEGKIKLGDKVNYCVPTGNFGNIFAAYLAKLMGLPVGKLICASNTNNVLTDFLRTGEYNRNRKFHLTMSPSMDILISSNLERLLYFTAGSAKTAEYMASLKETGAYKISADLLAKINETFIGYYADEAETAETIKATLNTDGYLADTHTSVALCCANKYLKDSGDKTPMVVASTASPYKFAADVFKSLSGKKPDDDLEALDMLSQLTNTEITKPLRGLADRKVNFKDVIDVSDMLEKVYDFAK